MTPTAETAYIPLTGWKALQVHGFQTHTDLRQLLTIEHPFKPSRAGGLGQWEVTTIPPKGWCVGEPLFVSFYQSDNYSGSWCDGAQTGTQAFIGHRFKQLLVNGHLVWEQDVADEELAETVDESEPTGDSYRGQAGQSGYVDPYRVVEITPHVRDNITLTFRVIDKVASTTRLPDDAYRRFAWSPFDPAEASQRFYTRVYFGDVCVTRENNVTRRMSAPIVSRVLQPRATAIPKAGIGLDLISTNQLPAQGYPVRTGVPMPQGAIRKGTSFALRDARQNDIPVMATETSYWPDGSVRWLLVEFVAATKGRYRLLPGATAISPTQPVKVRKRAGAITVSNGTLTLKIGKQTGRGVYESLSLDGGLQLGPMDLSIKLNCVGWRDHFIGHRHHATVEYSSPVCTTVRVEGDMLDDRQQRFGSWRARLQIWAGLPYVLMDWRLVNESDQAMAMLLDWSARSSLPDLDDAVVDFGPFEPGFDANDPARKGVAHNGHIEKPRAISLYKNSELSCWQERADQARIYRNTSWSATTDQAAGFVNVRHSDGGVVGAMRWFAEEFPKGIVVRPNLLSLATLPESEDAMGWPHDRPFVRIGRGEAKRQSFALYLHDGRLSSAQAERFNKCVQDAPRLFDRSWFIASGAIETGPARDEPQISKWAESATPSIERTGIGAPRLGHREYWDTAWSNDYRGRTHQGLIQYIETGDPTWFRYFDAACTHNRDVDIIHFCPEHPDWVGAVHSYGPDHTSCGPMGNIGSNCDGMLDHYLLTGDPDSHEAARGLAEHLLSLDCWERSARGIGWPLSQIVRWYDHSGDGRFLLQAEELMEAARAYVEPRRGIFSEMHGCWNYRGAVPFMTGYLAFGLIRYHQLTQSAEVLKILHLLLEGLMAESRPRKGHFIYSPFPENNGLEPMAYPNADIAGLAGYLYCMTGENHYGEWAMECYDAILKYTPPPVHLDFMTMAGWMLHAVVRYSQQRVKQPIS